MLIKSSKRTNKLTSLVLPEVKVLQVLSRDIELNIYKRKPTEDGEELVVSEDGIQPMLNSVLVELVNSVTIIELKLTKRSTESEKRVILKVLQLLPISPKNTLLL